MQESSLNPTGIFSAMGEEIYLYLVDIDKYLPEFPAFRRLLSDDELKRADSMASPEKGRKYVLCRALLRKALSRHLGQKPEKVLFRYSGTGKPYLAESDNPHSIRFNISHSDNLLLIGVTGKNEIGVDIEKIKEIPSMDLIFSRYATTEEQKRMASCSSDEKLRYFYSWWTRKESTGKAVGSGIGSLETPELLHNGYVETFESAGYTYSVCIDKY